MPSGNAKIGHPAPNFKTTAIMPDGQFKITINDLPVGPSEDEIPGLVQAFQFTGKHGEMPGSDTIKPDVQKSKEYFSKQK
uniref:thioredoxin-dependent peroxiredoxin n=1 Tax=Nannospalax galili TaxID=1026970 RepID=A0A8C6WDF2_NANGA